VLPLTTIAGALLPPTPTYLLQKNLPRLLALIKWTSARSLSTAKSRYFCCLTSHPLTAYFSLHSLLASIHIYGLYMGESPPHINFNKRSHPARMVHTKRTRRMFLKIEQHRSLGTPRGWQSHPMRCALACLPREAWVHRWLATVLCALNCLSGEAWFQPSPAFSGGYSTLVWC
jgi:hypothetical protein